MAPLSISVFDFFSYAIPGLFVLLAFVVGFNSQMVKLSDVALLFPQISIVTAIAMVIGGYILGFFIDTPGSWLYANVASRAWGSARTMYSDSVPDGDKRILVRHFSPENETYLQNWKVAKTMAHNLAFACVVAISCSIFKITQVSPTFRPEWAALAGFCALACVTFLERSHTFDRWHYRDLSDMYRVLNLDGVALVEQGSPKPPALLDAGLAPKHSNKGFEETPIDK